MEKLEIEGTEATPHIVCDASEGVMKFSGRSIPENATSFYSPVIEWLTSYSSSPKESTNLNFDLDYINSISQKIILDILYRLEDLSKDKGGLINVKWHYEKGDDEIKDEGEIFASKVDVNFELIEIELK